MNYRNGKDTMKPAGGNPSPEFAGLEVGLIVKTIGYLEGFVKQSQSNKWGVIRRFNRNGKPVVQLSTVGPRAYLSDRGFIASCRGNYVTIPMRPMIRTIQEVRAMASAAQLVEDAQGSVAQAGRPHAISKALSEPKSALQTTPDEGHEGGLRVGTCASCGNRFVPNYERSMGLLICDSCYWDWHSKPEKEDVATSGYDGKGNVYMRFLAAVAKIGVTDPNRSRLFDDVEKIGVYMGAADWRTLYLLLQSLRITYRTWESD